MDARRRPASGLSKKIFHKTSVMINASCRMPAWSFAVSACGRRGARRRGARCFKNPCVIGVFSLSRSSASRTRAPRGDVSKSVRSLRRRTQHLVSRRSRRCTNERKHWFFCHAVVIRLQCSRSPRALIDVATHSWLGGQHGEEAKDESESSGEKGRTEDQAPEEEVTTRRSSVVGFERCR